MNCTSEVQYTTLQFMNCTSEVQYTTLQFMNCTSEVQFMNCRVVYCTMAFTQRCNSRIAGQCIAQWPSPRHAIHVLQGNVMLRNPCIFCISRGRPVQYSTLQYMYCICGWRHGAIHYSAIHELHLWVKTRCNTLLCNS